MRPMMLTIEFWVWTAIIFAGWALSLWRAHVIKVKACKDHYEWGFLNGKDLGWKTAYEQVQAAVKRGKQSRKR